MTDAQKSISAVCLTLLLALAGCSNLPNSQSQDGLAVNEGAGVNSPENSYFGSANDKPEADEAAVAAYDPYCLVSEEQWAQFPPYQYSNLWDRIREGFQLTFKDNARIENQLTWYVKNHSYFDRVTERASLYLHAIVEKLEDRQMPLELALLPIVESAFDPFAYSPGRASGMWQFIPATGRRYGLKQNFWYDGRRDVEASTDAALDYLSDLQQRFKGDWLLALAAYNTGEGNVQKAIRRNQRAGKPTDFWSLRLPRETQAYVPQLLALSLIVADPDAHNLSFREIPNQAYYSVVDIDSQIDLARAADLAELSMDDLYLLNPGFNKWATAPNGPHRLLLPVDKAEVFASNLVKLPSDQRLQWQNYTIKPGDSLLKIAKKFNTSVSTLKQVNNISGTTIRAGKSLLIPVASESGEHYAYSDAQRLQRIQSSPKNDRQKVTYTVKPGDSFWKIARRHSVSVSQLTRWNGLAPKDKLRIGQRLVVWVKPADNVKVAAIPQSTEVIRKVNYRVRNGDSLARIAGKFNLTVKQIANWNAAIARKKYIHPGQLLTLWIDVTESNL